MACFLVLARRPTRCPTTTRQNGLSAISNHPLAKKSKYAFVPGPCASKERTWARISFRRLRLSPSALPRRTLQLSVITCCNYVKSPHFRELYSRVNLLFARQTRWPLRRGVMEPRSTRAPLSTSHFSPWNLSHAGPTTPCLQLVCQRDVRSPVSCVGATPLKRGSASRGIGIASSGSSNYRALHVPWRIARGP